AVAALIKPTIAAPNPEIAQTSVRPTLRLGSTGNSVTELQALLVLLGYYNSPVNGTYEDNTATAVRTFQSDVGLTSDGIVGPATWEKLLPTPSTELNPPEVLASTAETADNNQPEEDKDEPVELPVLRQGMYGPAVTRIQEALSELGFYDGAIDGAFGPGTEAAVMDFQRSVQLAADGVVGPATWGALLR
ncbi:MAG: peptidoglycan-binding protein, partial [Leptolyngbya sp. SIO1D8]|nr:peptidoglycan-binding protein [Leptolyngbya sp. SIO1D8]